MLPEISLNILDITQNSIAADADEISICLERNTRKKTLTVVISDNGKGMDEETVKEVTDPFFTTRTTRKVGLGIPFFKQEAECTGGNFSITSKPGEGTTTKAVFCTAHIDCMPLGDINATILTLITMNESIRFVYEYRVNESEFLLDTRQMREILGAISFSQPQVRAFLKEYLEENESEVNDKENLDMDYRE